MEQHTTQNSKAKYYRQRAELLRIMGDEDRIPAILMRWCGLPSNTSGSHGARNKPPDIRSPRRIHEVVFQRGQRCAFLEASTPNASPRQ